MEDYSIQAFPSGPTKPYILEAMTFSHHFSRNHNSSVHYGLSVNIYGRGDATLEDEPSHVGIALYEQGSSTC